jgi:hypothetical protein
VSCTWFAAVEKCGLLSATCRCCINTTVIVHYYGSFLDVDLPSESLVDDSEVWVQMAELMDGTRHVVAAAYASIFRRPAEVIATSCSGLSVDTRLQCVVCSSRACGV